MQRCAGAQPLGDLAAVDFGDFTRGCDHRDHDRAVEVLMSALAQKSDALQLSADRSSLDSILLRQSVAERAIGIAQAERLDRFLRADAAALEVIERLGA